MDLQQGSFNFYLLCGRFKGSGVLQMPLLIGELSLSIKEKTKPWPQYSLTKSDSVLCLDFRKERGKHVTQP